MLRDQIDTLRRERVVFDEIYRKLDNDLSHKKMEMAAIIDQANTAYEARDSAQAQMAQLKQQAEKEHQEFEKEWRDLGRRIEKDKAAISLNMEKVTTFEEAFAKIQAATGISDIDELVQNFINAEDQNFSLFNYNNLLSSDIEKLEQHIEDFKKEHEQLMGLSNGKEDADKAKVLENLEQKWNNIDKKAEQYEQKHSQAQKTLTQVRAGIQSIFSRLGLSPDDLPGGG